MVDQLNKKNRKSIGSLYGHKFTPDIQHFRTRSTMQTTFQFGILNLPHFQTRCFLAIGSEQVCKRDRTIRLPRRSASTLRHSFTPRTIESAPKDQDWWGDNQARLRCPSPKETGRPKQKGKDMSLRSRASAKKADRTSRSAGKRPFRLHCSIRRESLYAQEKCKEKRERQPHDTHRSASTNSG
jgi:hypothetical protein